MQNFGAYCKRWDIFELSLTLPQCKALFHLSRNELVRSGWPNWPSGRGIVAILDRQSDGWVERRPNSNDRRARTFIWCWRVPILQQIDKLSAQMRSEALAGRRRYAQSS